MPAVKNPSQYSDADVHIVELDNGPPDDTGSSNKDSEHSATIIAQDDELLTSDELLSFTSDELLSFTSDELLSFTSDEEFADMGIPDDTETSSTDLGSLVEDFLDFPSSENTLNNAEIQKVHNSAQKPHGRDAASNHNSAHAGAVTLESRKPTASPDMEDSSCNLTSNGGQHQSEDQPPNTEKDRGARVSTPSEQGTDRPRSCLKPAKHSRDGTSKGRLTLSQ
jgi:hypothetical protein